MDKILKKYIKAKIHPLDKFEENSLYIFNICEGVQAVVGRDKKTKKLITQSYMFDKKKWEDTKAIEWCDKHKELDTKVHKRVIIASLKLCDTMPNLSLDKQIKVSGIIEQKNKTEAELNDKYFFYVEGVHEGPNLNGDYFLARELAENYRSAAHQPIDWEHFREQVIGFTADSQLIADTDKPLAVAFNGVLHRISPHMQVVVSTDSNGVETTRDDLIKVRYFEGKLAVSMEVLFDSIRCVHEDGSECGFETDDFFEFEHHRATAHAHEMDKVFRGLIGIDFIGFGIVTTPADPEADVMSLRTSDDGILEDIVAAGYQAKYNELVSTSRFTALADSTTLGPNVFISNLVANSVPDLEVINGKCMLFAKKDKIITKNRTKKAKKDDKDIKEQANNKVNNNNQGGTAMFKLSERTNDAKSLSDIFVIAQEILKDFMGADSTTLSTEEVESFNNELNEVVSARIASNDFKIENIYTLTKQAKLDAISGARDEEKKLSDVDKGELNKSIATKDEELVVVKAELNEANKTIKDMKDAESSQKLDEDLNSFVDSITSAGVSLTDSMKNSVKLLAKANVKEDGTLDEDKNKELYKEFIAMAKQTSLENASKVLGGASGKSEIKDNDDLSKGYENIHKEIKEAK